MAKYKETPAPPPGPLHMGYWNLRGRTHGWRPRGTRDWLLLFTEEGSALVRYQGGEFQTAPGDVVLFQPGTPQDYGQHDPRKRWKNIWTHWLPRRECLSWLLWPELSPGLRFLRLPRPTVRAVRKELTLGHAVLQSDQPRREALAANALERALLYCDRANPRHSKRPLHPRIEEALDYLNAHLNEPHSLENLARRFGFSRSRFAALFHRQVGQPPRQYLEFRRLAQARELLQYTNQTLAQIADQTGFSSAFYLSLRFKKHFGKNPRAFRRKESTRIQKETK